MTFIDNELAERIHAACEMESQEIDNELAHSDRSFSYTFNRDRITEAISYFIETGETIVLLKVVNSLTIPSEICVYYVFHNDRFFTVVTNNGEITQCMAT
jgi:hypothetical protein